MMQCSVDIQCSAESLDYLQKQLFLFICLFFHYVKEVSWVPTKIRDSVLDGFIYIKVSFFFF